MGLNNVTGGSTLADLNRDQGVADDAGWQTTRAVLLTDLATITDRERFRERVERWLAEDAKAVGCTYVEDLQAGQSFRFRPNGTTHTVTSMETWDSDDDLGRIYRVDTIGNPFFLPESSCVQLVEVQP